jgi:site-specific recombinase XerD
VHLNRFFRELPGWGVRSQHSIDAYTRDVMLFCRFLQQSRGGKLIWDCDSADLRAYKQVRLRTPGPQQVSVSTWRRSIAALDKWVAWARYEDLLAAEPFRYIDKTVLTPQGLKQVRVNAEQEPDAQSGPIRFLPYEDYLRWRNVGLRGELPDGRPDPGWRGRHGERNSLFADLLVGTGMRLGEAASLLIAEVPPGGTNRVDGLHLAAAVTKRNRPRTVFMNARTLRAVHRYIDIERDELVHRPRRQGNYDVVPESLAVRGAGRHALTLADGGGSWAYAKLDPDTRHRLMRINEHGQASGPLALWLGEDGLPLRRSTWQSAFRRANQRCASFGLQLAAHPHTLRHTYAVHMLGLLLRHTVRALGIAEDRRLDGVALRRLLIGNPMRRLQLLLGHGQEATVYAYLDVLDEAQEIVQAAVADWDALTVGGEPAPAEVAAA